MLVIILIPTPTAIWKHVAILHSPKGRECEARSHLGSPLGELCNIVYCMVSGVLKCYPFRLKPNFIEMQEPLVQQFIAINYTDCCVPFLMFPTVPFSIHIDLPSDENLSNQVLYHKSELIQNLNFSRLY